MNIDINDFLEKNNNDSEIEVQQAVVESLAAEKVQQEETIEQLNRKCADLERDKSALQKENEELVREKAKLSSENEILSAKLNEINLKINNLEEQFTKLGALISQEEEVTENSKVTLLERDVEIKDRFPSETYDHVIEVIREARDRAEKEGRERLGQILESVLLANESTGSLKKERLAIEKLFEENSNVINGSVMERLDKLGISYKSGENYLLVKEILTKSF